MLMEQSLRLSSAMRHAFSFNLLASGYVCRQCRHRGSAIAQSARIFHPVSTSFRQYASSGGNENTITERIRRRLWKTEPPGQKDPYSIEERDALRAEEARRVAEEKAIANDPAEQDSQGGQYVQATTWDGLEQIGGATGWWEEAWDKVNQFEGFMAPSRMQSKEDISIAIHRALIEVYTLKEADLPIVFPTWADAPYDSNWGAIAFQKNENGTMVPIFPNEQIRQKILYYLTNAEPRDDPTADFAVEDAGDVGMEEQVPLDQSLSPEGELEALTVDNPEDDITPENGTTSSASLLVDTSWLTVPLDDINIKFAILKRVMQLTGIRIPDPAIADLTSAKTLLGHLVRKPMPKKLADRLIANEDISNLPNLQIMDRRYTPIDREKEIGRWKIIEKELIKRDLPVTGTE